jgi:hypothetical protein
VFQGLDDGGVRVLQRGVLADKDDVDLVKEPVVAEQPNISCLYKLGNGGTQAHETVSASHLVMSWIPRWILGSFTLISPSFRRV